MRTKVKCPKNAQSQHDASRWRGERLAGSQVLLIALLELGGADDVADLLRLSAVLAIEVPGALVTVAKGEALVVATEDADSAAVLVLDLAPVLGVNILAKAQLNGLEGTGVANRTLLVALAGGQGGLGANLFGRLAAQEDDNVALLLLVVVLGELKVAGLRLLELGVALDFADLLALAARDPPGAFTAIGEGLVNVVTAGHDDGVAVLVVDLATKILLLDLVAETELDRGPRAAVIEPLLLGEVGLLEDVGGGVVRGAEADSDVAPIERPAVGTGSSHDAGGGEHGDEDGGILHFA